MRLRQFDKKEPPGNEEIPPEPGDNDGFSSPGRLFCLLPGRSAGRLSAKSENIEAGLKVQLPLMSKFMWDWML